MIYGKTYPPTESELKLRQLWRELLPEDKIILHPDSSNIVLWNRCIQSRKLEPTSEQIKISAEAREKLK